MDATRQTTSYVVLHYTLADGSPAKFRATSEHVFFVASSIVSFDAAAPAPPKGTMRRMDRVRVGDLLAVRAEEGHFYTAEVSAITT